MSYYLRILCKIDVCPSAHELETFVREGAFFDTGPAFECVAADAHTSQWETLAVTYDVAKRPVIIVNTGQSDLLSEELGEIRDIAATIGDDAVLRHIDSTVRVIAVEIDQVGLSDEAWEMVDCVQSFVASRCEGMIYAPDDGFFDKRLKRIVAV